MSKNDKKKWPPLQETHYTTYSSFPDEKYVPGKCGGSDLGEGNNPRTRASLGYPFVN